MFEKKEADDMKMIRSNNIFLTYSPEGKEAVEGEVKQEVTKEVIVPEVPQSTLEEYYKNKGIVSIFYMIGIEL